MGHEKNQSSVEWSLDAGPAMGRPIAREGGFMNLKALFEPKHMAVIGVSLTNDRHPANVIYNKNNLRYPVEVFPVNPRGGMLQGEQVFTRIIEIPHKVDLAVIAARADRCPEILEECILAGVGGAAVISGGFAETGRKDLQDRLVEIAREARFPFIGPNCLGIHSPSCVDTFFLPSERMVRPDAGDVAVVSQSGGVLVDLMVKFAEEGIGLSLAVSIGNKALIKELDLLGYLVDDPRTSVIALYLEGFHQKEGRGFLMAAKDSPKRLVVLKAGKSAGGSRAVSSHTASLAGDYEIFSSVMSQYGVIEAKNELELVSFCESLSCYKGSIKGRIGMVTGSGGHGALAVDVCSSHCLRVPTFSEDMQEIIRADLSPSVQNIASLANPIDLTGSAVDDDFVFTVRTLSRRSEIDCVMVLLLPYLPGITSDLGARLSNVYQQEGKPIIAYVPHVEKYRMLIEGFELNRIPVSPSIEGAVSMALAMRKSGGVARVGFE
jgi:acyl-CoA synthetase (NDP forming)